MPAPRPWLIAAAAFAYWALIGAFFFPVLGTGRYLGDAADQLIEALPLYGFSHPLWEPRAMLGFPMYANATHPYWYPLALILRGVPNSYDAYELCAFIIAATGTFGLARALTKSTLGAAIAGGIFALSGFMIGHIGHVDIVQPAAWVPWLFWALVSARETGATRSLAGIAIAVALIASAGQPQIFVYAFALAVSFVVVFARSAPAGAARFAAGSAGALALGVALAAIVLVPQWELARQSVRAQLPFSTFIGFAVPAGELPLRLFFPMLLGSTPMPPYAFSNFDFGSFSEMTVFVGTTTLALAAIAIAACLRSGDVRYWLAVAVLALALGTDAGLQNLTYHLPIYDLFRAPNRHAFEAALAFALLAAYGIAAVETGRATPRVVRWSCAAVGAVALILATLLASFPQLLIVQVRAVLGPVRFSLDPFENAALWLPLLTLATGIAATIWWSLRPRASARAVLLGLALAADLGSFGWFAYWNFGAFSAARLEPPPYAARLRELLAAAPGRVLTVPTQHLGSGIPPNLNLLWDLPSARGYVPLTLATTQALLPSDSAEAMLPLLESSDQRLDVAAVRFLIVPGGEDAPVLAALAAHPDRFRELPTGGSDRVFENRRALPMTWIVHAGAPQSGGFAQPAQAARTGEYVRFDERSPDRLALTARCVSACIVVTSDAFYPGWTARVDGATQPILRADIGLRAVALEPGTHRMLFAFRPLTVYASAAISVAAALAVAFLALRRDRRREFALRDSS